MREYSILLVDDDDLILRAISDGLSAEGYMVTTAQSGEAAFEILEKKYFDIVITDLVMGMIDGTLVLKKTKELYPEAMVIILTGNGSMESAIQAVKLKADDYLLKPCESSELNYRVKRCVELIEKNRMLSFYESILPVCMYCRCVKSGDDTAEKSGWIDMEEYLNRKSNLSLSHTFCPKCQEQAKKDMLGE